MALSCPNKSLPEWKRLVDEVGEREALNDYFQFGTIRSPYAVKDKLERLNIANYTNRNFKIGERYFKPTVEFLIDVEKNSSVVDAMVTHFGYRGLQSEEDLIKRKFTDDIRLIENRYEGAQEESFSLYSQLTNQITQDNKSYYRGQIEKPTIDENGNLVLHAKEDELYKRAGLKSKGVSMTDDLQSAIEYGKGQLDVSKNLASEENIGIDLERELDRLDENGYYLIQIPKNISNEIVKEAGEVKVIGDKIVIPKGQYKIEQVIDGVDTEITPEQKQQATFLFSKFLDVYLQDYEQVEKILKQENIIQKKCS